MLKKLKNNPILKHDRLSKANVIVFALIFAAIGGYIIFHSFAATFTANLYVVASGGSPNCVRSATPVDYPTATANNNVCGYGNGNSGQVASAWYNACIAASKTNTSLGTIIGVKAGNFTSPLGRLFEGDPNLPSSNFNCSGGLGADVNPNATEQGVTTGTTTGWAKYECADGDTTKNVSFSTGGQAFLWGSFHTLIQGGCFDFDTISIGAGGSPSTVRSSELQFIGGPNCATDPAASDCMHMIGIDIKGAKDVLFKNVNYGPSLQCAKNDPAVNPAYRCDPSVPFEAPFANLGTATSACGPNDIIDCGGFFSTYEQPQSYIHYGDGTPYQNIRVQNMYQHDANQVFASGLAHSGCTMSDNNLGNLPAYNLVYDHLVCERFEIVGQQDADSGIAIENSVFGCATYQFDQATPAGAWDSCAPAQAEMDVACRADLTPGCVLSNMVIRYNVFLGNSAGLRFRPPSATFGTFSNVQVIGNIFAQQPAGCTISGITCDSNVFLNGVPTAGSNSKILTPGDPFVQSSILTSGHTWSSTSLLDAHPTGSISIPTVPNLGSDYNLATDADGNTRTYPTIAGAYIGTSSSNPPPSVSISAVPTTITSGSSSTLTWTSTNATACTASGAWSGSQATSGSASTGALTTSSTFSLNCSGAGGSTQASTSVTVNNAPPPPAPPPTTPPPTVKGDCNGDGHVTIIDLSILLSHYGTNYPAADFDKSSTVNIIDLSILLSNYGR
jgi:hypothetical protein